MFYKDIAKGTFIERPNRFIAYVDIGGERKMCHVKNTGRLKELLVRGAAVILEKPISENRKTERKTEYDLVGVYKGNELINIDSLAPNRVFGEWAKNSGFFGDAAKIKPEAKYKNSRFDYYIESGERMIFAEVKGVTLVDDGTVRFPDAPTQRGVKHINELTDAKKNGFESYIFFVAQMKNCICFTPNRDTHPEFADALKNAAENGVEIRCVNCKVSENCLEIDRFIEVKL